MRYCMILFVAGVLTCGEFVGLSTVYAGIISTAATVTIRATKLNGVFLPSPTSSIDNVAPGDSIEMDLYISNWSNGGLGDLRAYQIMMNALTYLVDPEQDCILKPDGWDAPIETQSCQAISVCLNGTRNGEFCGINSDCPGGTCLPSAQCQDPDYPICNPWPNIASAFCTGTDFDPARGAFIKQKICSGGSNDAGFCTGGTECPGGTCINNADFVFDGLNPNIVSVVTNALDEYTFASLLFQGGEPDIGEERYIGTLILVADPQSKGTYNIAINELIGISLIFDEFSTQNVLETIPLTITMVNPVCNIDPCFIVESNPPDCAVDARFPWLADDFGTRLAWKSIDITFSDDQQGNVGCDVSTFVASDFSVSLHGSGSGFPPIITNITNLGNRTLRLQFSSNIRPRRYTCVTFLSVSSPDLKNQVCIGNLPGDVDASVESNAGDVSVLIDHLNGEITPLDPWKCDIDRSGSCQPGDLLGVIDLLNGAGQFIPGFFGATISVPCPSAP